MRFALVFAFTFALAACTPEERPRLPDGGCEEPNPRDPKGLGEGEPCETSFQCNGSNLVCMGLGPDRVSICTPPLQYQDPPNPPLDLWDPGCHDDPINAPVGHCDDADLVEEIEIGEEVGCDGHLRIYEIPDPCCADAKGDCRFDCTDYVRHEVWRNCGCCWRMVSLIELTPEQCR